MIFITAAIVFGNLLSLLIRLTHRKLRKQVSSHFIQSLAVADLCVGLFHALPGLLHSLFLLEKPSDRWVSINVFFAMTVTNVSLYSVLSISVDRYIAIMKPLRYRSLVRTRPCQVIIVCTWIWAAVLMTPSTTPWVSTYYSHATFTSSINHKANKIFMAMILLLVYFPTLLAVTFIYPRLMCVARRHLQREKLVRRSSSITSRQILPESVSHRTKYLRSTILVTATYYITYVPRGVSFLYKTIAHPVPWLEFITLWLYISTSFLNCVIYSWGKQAISYCCQGTVWGYIMFCQTQLSEDGTEICASHISYISEFWRRK